KNRSTSEVFTLSLHDALPISLETYVDDDWRKPFEEGSWVHGLVMEVNSDHATVRFGSATARVGPSGFAWTKKVSPRELFAPGDRSEEHTSELQSPCNLVCRLL